MLHPVSDVATAKAVYAALLGVEPQTDDSYWPASRPPVSTSGWCRAVDREPLTSTVAYWHVPDIEAKLAEQSCIDPSRRRLTGRYLGSYGNLAAASSSKLTPKPGWSPGCMYPSRKA